MGQCTGFGVWRDLWRAGYRSGIHSKVKWLNECVGEVDVDVESGELIAKGKLIACQLIGPMSISGSKLLSFSVSVTHSLFLWLKVGVVRDLGVKYSCSFLMWLPTVIAHLERHPWTKAHVF